jgi:multisubunit Na+/H+ antiporter MnhE subunit
MADRRPHGARTPPHRAAHWLGWLAASMVLWLLLTTTFDWQEELVGFVASALAATVVHAVRTWGPFAFRPRVRWIRHAVALPSRIVVETATVFAALVRHATGRKRVRGSWAVVPLRHGPPAEPEAAARRALATAGISVSPNTYVVGVDAGRDEMLIHQLVSDEATRRRLGGRS